VGSRPDGTKDLRLYVGYRKIALKKNELGRGYYFLEIIDYNINAYELAVWLASQRGISSKDSALIVLTEALFIGLRNLECQGCYRTPILDRPALKTQV
jgi:hypothetical protein